MSEFLHYPLVRGLISGFLAAVVIDLQAFRAWQSYSDVWLYDWRLASWRWIQGALLGAFATLGLGEL